MIALLCKLQVDTFICAMRRRAAGRVENRKMSKQNHIIKYKSSLTGKRIDLLPSTKIFPIKLNHSHSSTPYQDSGLQLVLLSTLGYHLFYSFLFLFDFHWIFLFDFVYLFSFAIQLPIISIWYKNCWLNKTLKEYMCVCKCVYFVCSMHAFCIES